MNEERRDSRSRSNERARVLMRRQRVENAITAVRVVRRVAHFKTCCTDFMLCVLVIARMPFLSSGTYVCMYLCVDGYMYALYR